jgi:Domain of Unknown Function (DUF1259)
MAPFMGFTSWAAFAPGMKDNVLVMGDMVLFEDEVNPVMSVALDKGLVRDAPLVHAQEKKHSGALSAPGVP